MIRPSYLPEIDAIVAVDKDLIGKLFDAHEIALEERDFGWAPVAAPWTYVNDVNKSD